MTPMTPFRLCLAALLLMAVSAHTAAQNNQTTRPRRVRVSQAVLQGNLLHQVDPIYPPEARDAGISGRVVLRALIGLDGVMRNLEVVSGPPPLLQAALDAVSQWTYRPWLLNDQPVEVETMITVPFVLQQGPPAPQ